MSLELGIVDPSLPVIYGRSSHVARRHVLQQWSKSLLASLTLLFLCLLFLHWNEPAATSPALALRSHQSTFSRIAAVAATAGVLGTLTAGQPAAPLEVPEYMQRMLDSASGIELMQRFTQPLLKAPDIGIPKDGEEWAYSTFIKAVKAGKVSEVLLNVEATRAQVTTYDGIHGTVNLLYNAKLFDLLAAYNVNFAVSEKLEPLPIRNFLVVILPSITFLAYLAYTTGLFSPSKFGSAPKIGAEKQDEHHMEEDGELDAMIEALQKVVPRLGFQVASTDDGLKSGDATNRTKKPNDEEEEPMVRLKGLLDDEDTELQQLVKSKARLQILPDTGVTFRDVAGAEDAKLRLSEVVDFLKSPGRYTAFGARIPRGILLTGPPGTGKTLLAKAVAGEAAVPFLSVSGSEFVEVYAGVGAARVRDLFKEASKHTPCIVFIDEIDAMGRARGVGIGMSNDEKEQTLNQLLIAMDGFEVNSGVIVLAATNRPDILDPALLRAGRFDRQIPVELPDLRARRSILQVHARNKVLHSSVNLDDVARQTPGLSGADLANVMNEAAILAARRSKDSIIMEEVNDAIDRIIAGMPGNPLKNNKSKELIAYHEVGHAICSTLTPGHDPVQKVTLIPRGQAQGLTWCIPTDEMNLLSRQQMFAAIVGALGGRAAEEVVFGKSQTTSGAAGDLQEVTRLARAMVVQYGFSDLGPWSLAERSDGSDDVVMRLIARERMSEKLAADIDRNVRRIVNDAYEMAKTQIAEHRAAMDAIVAKLLEVETLSGDEVRAILSRYTCIPEQNLEMLQALQHPIPIEDPQPLEVRKPTRKLKRRPRRPPTPRPPTPRPAAGS